MAQIYVASLGDYNSGRLHGKWIDLENLEFEDLMKKVQEIFHTSPYFKEYILDLEKINIKNLNLESKEFKDLFNNYFEWAIHDYEGFGDLNIEEYEGLEEVLNKSKIFSEIDERFKAFIKYKEDLGHDDYLQEIDYEIEQLEEDFNEYYVGEGDSKKDLFWEVVSQFGDIKDAFNIDSLYYWFDWDSYWDDIKMDMEEGESESYEGAEDYIEQVYGDSKEYLKDNIKLFDNYLDEESALIDLEIGDWNIMQMENRNYIAFRNM